jgi:hypothetical protein
MNSVFLILVGDQIDIVYGQRDWWMESQCSRHCKFLGEGRFETALYHSGLEVGYARSS